jgi:hypothetical protein
MAKSEDLALAVHSSALCSSPRGVIEHISRQPKKPALPYLPSLHSLCCGFSEQLRTLEHTSCDRAHIGPCSSALPVIERTLDLAAH